LAFHYSSCNKEIDAREEDQSYSPDSPINFPTAVRNEMLQLFEENAVITVFSGLHDFVICHSQVIITEIRMVVSEETTNRRSRWLQQLLWDFNWEQKNRGSELSKLMRIEFNTNTFPWNKYLFL
jgi:hypothetical protein